MDFSFTEEQELFRRTVREWCQKRLPIEKVREMDTKGVIPTELITEMSDLGLIIMTAPEDHGGVGADWVTACIAAEELGYADISVALPVLWLVGTSWGFVTDRYASERVREEVIRPAIKGKAFIGIGATESGGGSDVAAYKTTGKKEGNNWIINGEKMYISGTEECLKMGGGFNTCVRTDPAKGHRGMTNFYLPLNAPGVEVNKRFDDMGRMAISTGGFSIDNVKLPDEYRLGEEGRGFYDTMEGFSMARLLIAAVCCGVARRALDEGIAYLKERKAFGHPLGQFQGIQFELADDETEYEATRSLTFRTAWLTDQHYQKGTLTQLDLSKYIAMIKAKAPHMAFDICKHVMMWFGAYGYTKECPVEMGLRGIFSYCVGAEGSTNIQRYIIAREVLGRDFKA